MRLVPAASLLVALLTTPTIAAAQAIAADAAPPPERRVDTRLGLLTGRNDLGDVTGPSTGLHASLGYRVGDVTAMAEYGYLGVGDASGDPMTRHGRMSRAGAVLRWMIADVAPRTSPVGAQFWIEGGAGYERTAWLEGGVLHRPDVAAGFGFELDGRGWREPRPRHFGVYLGFRAIAARAPASDAPAMCEGPCTAATPPSRNDVAMYFTFGLHWGR